MAIRDDSPKKSLGQHWLRNEAVLRDICSAADLQPDDTVLEIGPGLGTLTEFLLQAAGEVIAVEFDKKLADKLPHRFADRGSEHRLHVISQDILSFDFTTLPVGYKLVANIPYYLTSNLIRVISETPNPPALAVLLVQKEVAERVAAKPGSMSLLSVTAQFYWQIELGNIVPAKLFEPAPKVDSQVLIMKHRTKPLFDNVNSKKFFHIVKAGFSQRRKTLLNSLSAGLRLERQDTVTLLENAGIESTQRAQTLNMSEWYKLYTLINA